MEQISINVNLPKFFIVTCLDLDYSDCYIYPKQLSSRLRRYNMVFSMIINTKALE